MNEYIKISDIPFIDLAEEHNTDIKVLVAFASDIANLPTIEVSDKADRPFEYLCGYEDGKKALLESLAVSVGDCISREKLLKDFGLSEKSRKYGGDHSGYQTLMLYEIQDIIEGAPSVVPKNLAELIKALE